MSNGIDAVDRGTMTFLEDSIGLARAAEADADSHFGNSLARGSLLASTLFLEACANSCLDMLVLENRFASEIDRLPLLGKFELYAKLAFPRKKLNRSRHEVQGLMELRRVRDSFVHSKRQRIIWERWSLDGGESRSPTTAALGLPKIATYCHFADAITAMRAAHAFSRYFLRDVCGFAPPRVSALFLSDDSVPNIRERHQAYWPTELHAWLKRHRIDMSYMRIGRL